MGVSNTDRGRKMRQRILEMIIRYIEEHGYQPTYREIGEAVGFASTSSIASHIQRMLKDGMLETDADTTCNNRAIRVPGYKFVKVDDNERVLQPQ